MKKQTIKLYYFILGGVVISQLVYTLLSGGSLLFTRGNIANLKQEQQQLKDQIILVEADKSNQASLTEILQSDLLADYTKISKPISIQTSNALALETN